MPYLFSPKSKILFVSKSYMDYCSLLGYIILYLSYINIIYKSWLSHTFNSYQFSEKASSKLNSYVTTIFK